MGLVLPAPLCALRVRPCGELCKPYAFSLFIGMQCIHGVHMGMDGVHGMGLHV